MQNQIRDNVDMSIQAALARWKYIDSVRRRITAVHHDQRGALSIVNIVSILFGLLLFVFVANVGHVVNDKIKAQNSADAVAYSGAVWQARGMNAITATNHLIGELTAIIIIHESVGGELLDNGGIAEDQGHLVTHEDQDVDTGSKLDDLNQRLEWAYQGADAIGGQTNFPAYEIVREQRGVHAEATVLDAKVTLKDLLIKIYGVKAAGRALQKFGYTYAAGVAMEWGAHAVELKILQEYLFLNAWESVAKSLTHVKRSIRTHMLRDAKKYTERVVDLIPKMSQQAAVQVALRNDVEGFLFEADPGLPVELDPHAKTLTLQIPDPAPIEIAGLEEGCCDCPSVRSGADRDQIVKITQLARATFPWVVYHRQPVLDVLGRFAPLSKAKRFYKDHTDGFSKRIVGQLQMHEDMGLYVIKKDALKDKGFSAWNGNPELADFLFCSIGVIHQRPPRVLAAPAIFKQQHRDGRIAMAQVMIYNANNNQRAEQKIDLTCKRMVPNRQADWGFDTLNWKAGTRPWELIAKTNSGGAPSPDFPEIEVNWQVKLVPTTAYSLQNLANSSTVAQPFNRLVDKLPLRTHTMFLTH